MRPIALLLALGLLPSCGLLIDGIYLSAPRRYETREIIREPVPGAVGEPDPACGGAPRPLVREFELTRHYERQNGLDRGAYGGAIAGDVLLGGILAGTLYAACTRGPDASASDMASAISCDGLYAVVPLGVDLVYSIARLATVRPPRLVGKDRSEGRIGPGACPSAPGR